VMAPVGVARLRRQPWFRHSTFPTRAPSCGNRQPVLPFVLVSVARTTACCVGS
jgi:hypothetical protein